MNKKQLFSILLILNIFVSQAISQPQYPTISPRASVSQKVGITDITVQYHRPGVKGRLIWGEQVPFDKLWQAGANNATTIEFSTEVIINGTKVPAGKYSFFILLEESKKAATLILNKNANLWCTSGYKEEDDIFVYRLSLNIWNTRNG